jgi:hypothetical protein
MTDPAVTKGQEELIAAAKLSCRDVSAPDDAEVSGTVDCASAGNPGIAARPDQAGRCPEDCRRQTAASDPSIDRQAAIPSRRLASVSIPMILRRRHMSGTWMTTRAWLLMLPLLVVMIAVIGWPLVDTVSLSFTDAKLVGTARQFRRYRQLCEDALRLEFPAHAGHHDDGLPSSPSGLKW